MRSDSFHDDDPAADDLAEYRPFNVIAAIAVLVALPGCLAVFLSAFLFFPIVALAMASFALWRSGSKPAGGFTRRLSAAAVTLSVLLIAFPATLQYLNGYHEFRFARQSAEQWIRLLRGEDVEKAYLLALPYNQRPTATGEDDSGGRQRRVRFAGDTQQQYMARPEISTITGSDEIHFERLWDKRVTGQRVDYHLAFELKHPQSGGKKLYAIIPLERYPQRDGTMQWKVGVCQITSTLQRR